MTFEEFCSYENFEVDGCDFRIPQPGMLQSWAKVYCPGRVVTLCREDVETYEDMDDLVSAVGIFLGISAYKNTNALLSKKKLAAAVKAQQLDEEYDAKYYGVSRGCDPRVGHPICGSREGE